MVAELGSLVFKGINRFAMQGVSYGFGGKVIARGSLGAPEVCKIDVFHKRNYENALDGFCD